jgi:Fe-S-cluster-containing hydrogenase component 2
MLNVICKQNCKACFAEPICAMKAIISQQGAIYVETAKCIGCGACRTACVTWSLDKSLKEKTVDWLMGNG